jgi:pseudouridylate synthase
MTGVLFPDWLDVDPVVADALRRGAPVVALESTVIAHGLPWPVNFQTALAAEQAVRESGSVPATIAVIRGRPRIGLPEHLLELLAKDHHVVKASRRDLAATVLHEHHAATTVSATMYLAHQVGIRLFATGGIGGVHGDAGCTWDVSADLMELARTPVAVVCAGAKSVLDIPATLEYLETNSVPVVGYRTDRFPAFYVCTSEQPVPVRVDSPEEAARLLKLHWAMQGQGIVLSQPLDPKDGLDPDLFANWLAQAESDALAHGVSGPALTPHLLRRLAELSDGKTLEANKKLVIANARLAALIARSLAQISNRGSAATSMPRPMN